MVLKKQTMVQGALVLTIAGILIRILGAVYRVPLGRILGDEGLGIYAVPNQFYLLFFTISSAGIPVAVARVISEKMSRGNYKDAYRTFKIAFFAMFGVGLIFSLLLFFGSNWLVDTGIVANPASLYGLKAVAPVIFFAALTSSFRGLFLGMQNMSPVAYSQVADQVMLVAGTITFSLLFLPGGLAMAAAGANLGAVPGAVTATCIMLFFFLKSRPTLVKLQLQDHSPFREKAWPLLKKILVVSVPISFASVAMAITGIIDNKLIIDRLQLIGYSQQQATAFYGQFNQMAMSFINVSIAFAFSMGTSLVPVVAELNEKAMKERIRRQISTALRLSLITTMPAAAGLFALSSQLTNFIYANRDAGIPLATVSFAVVFWGVHLVLSGVLQGLGRADIPVRNLLVGILFKIGITYYFTPGPLGIRAAALGTVAMFVIASTLNFISVKRMVGLDLDIPATVIKPLLASLIMALAARQAYFLSLPFANHEYLATTWAVAAGMVLYPLLMILTGGLRSSDLKSVPRVGTRLASFLATFEKLRDRLAGKK